MANARDELWQKVYQAAIRGSGTFPDTTLGQILSITNAVMAVVTGDGKNGPLGPAIEVTFREGGIWYKWPIELDDADENIFAVRFASDLIWDRVIGWRKA